MYTGPWHSTVTRRLHSKSTGSACVAPMHTVWMRGPLKVPLPPVTTRVHWCEATGLEQQGKVWQQPFTCADAEPGAVHLVRDRRGRAVLAASARGAWIECRGPAHVHNLLTMEASAMHIT